MTLTRLCVGLLPSLEMRCPRILVLLEKTHILACSDAVHIHEFFVALDEGWPHVQHSVACHQNVINKTNYSWNPMDNLGHRFLLQGWGCGYPKGKSGILK